MAQRPVPPVQQADGAEIRDVQDQLLAVERAMIVTGDPSAPMFGALAAFSGELHRSYLIGEAQRQALTETIQSLVLPAATLSDKQVEQVAQRVAQSSGTWAHRLARTALFNAASICIAALLTMTALGFLGGFLYRGDRAGALTIAGVRAGAERCEDRPDGSRLCWIPVFERLPPTTKGEH